MAFWGVEVKPGKPFTLKANPSQARLRVSQATLGVGNATNKSIVQCNVGVKSPIFLCTLSPGNVESYQLNLEFEEEKEVIFSIIGPRSVHLSGYYLSTKKILIANDDDSETYGEDIVDTETERSSADNDYDYSDSFINDAHPSTHIDSPDSDSVDDSTVKERVGRKKKSEKIENRRRLRKKYQVSDSSSGEKWKLGAFAGIDNSSSDQSVGLVNDENDVKIHNSPPREAKSQVHTKSKGTALQDNKNDSVDRKTLEADVSLTHKVMDKGGDNLLDDPLKSKKSKRKETRNVNDVKVVVEDNNKAHNLAEGVPMAMDAGKGEADSMDMNTLKEDVHPINEVTDEGGDKQKPSKKKKRKDTKIVDVESKSCNEVDNGPDNLSKDVQSEKPAIANDEPLKKKRKRGRHEYKETSDSLNGKTEVEASSTGLIIEELGRGNLEGKSAVKGKKISITYTAKLKDKGHVFDSNVGKPPLRFRLGGNMVIEGLSIGVEGMRVGDKRRITIPPSLRLSDGSGFIKEGSAEDLPKDAWLVYEVEAVKVR